MTQSLQMRTASLGASALLLGGALIAALSFKYVLPVFEIPEPPVVIGDVETPPTPPPEPIRETITRPTIENQILLDTLGPSVNADMPPIETAAVFGPPQVTTVTNPTWVERPQNLERYYPRRALRMNMEGSATLDCRVGVDGRLDCAILSETPPEWGFGEAARRIASEYRMVPAMRNGQAIEARYVMRVPFNLE